MPRGNWNTVHGGNRRGMREPEYSVWAGMRARCRNQNHKDFKNYGGRGIIVDDRWKDYSTFLADMGRRPTAQHTIERLDVNGPYSPDNCIWLPKPEQARNRRPRTQATACRSGHPLTNENTYHRPDGKRGCRLCRQANMKSFYQRQGVANA